MPKISQKTLIIACGALSHEIVDLIRINCWNHIALTCLPAYWHHVPQRIPEGLRKKIRQNRDKYKNIYVMYGDCGTWGAIDAVVAEEGAERIEGPHCFSFLMGNDHFDAYSENEITTFYLTDFFCRYFDKFVWEALGLNRRDDMVDFVCMKVLDLAGVSHRLDCHWKGNLEQNDGSHQRIQKYLA